MTYYQGKAADDFLRGLSSRWNSTLPAMNALTLDLTLGGEVRASKSMDLYVHIPLALTVWSNSTPTYIEGSGRIEQNELIDPSVSELGLIGGGVIWVYIESQLSTVQNKVFYTNGLWFSKEFSMNDFKDRCQALGRILCQFSSNENR